MSTQTYPAAAAYARFTDEVAEGAIEWLRAVLTGVRRIRSEMNIAPGKAIPLLFAGGGKGDRDRAGKFADAIAFLGRTESQRWLDAGENEPAAAAAIVGELKILIPLAGLIDVGAEKVRLAREVKRIEGEIARCNGKLANANFIANAPAEVVEQEQQRLKDFASMLAALRGQLDGLNAL